MAFSALRKRYQPRPMDHDRFSWAGMASTCRRSAGRGSAARGTGPGERLRRQPSLQSLPSGRRGEILQESPLQERRIRQRNARTHRVRRLSRSWARPHRGTRRKSHHHRFFPARNRKQILDNCLRCHSRDAVARQHPPFRSHRERCGVHQLPLHPRLHHAKIPAGESAIRTLLRMPRRCSFAILHAVQASRQRRRHERAAIATIRTARSLRRGEIQRQSSMVNQVAGNEEACLKCHEEKRGPFVVRASAGPHRRLRGLPFSARLAEFAAAAAAGGLHHVPGVS